MRRFYFMNLKTTKINFKISVILMAVFVVLLFLAPRAINLTTADHCYMNTNYNYSASNPCYFYQQPLSHTSQNIPSGQIYTSGQLLPLDDATGCLWNQTISWNTQNASQVQVTVRDPDTGMEKLFAADTNGSAAAPWLAAGKMYTFTLWSTNQGQRHMLGQTTIDLRGFKCGLQHGHRKTPHTHSQHHSSQFYNYQSSTYNSPIYSSPPVTQYQNPHAHSSLATDFTLSHDGQHCIGQAPRYTVTAPSSMSSYPIHWISKHNDQITHESTYTLGGPYNAPTWSDWGSTWGPQHVGTWTKTAVINNVSKTITFTVRDCGGGFESSGSSYNYPSNYPSHQNLPSYQPSYNYNPQPNYQTSDMYYNRPNY
jgi:hypothetical protein